MRTTISARPSKATGLSFVFGFGFFFSFLFFSLSSPPPPCAFRWFKGVIGRGKSWMTNIYSGHSDSQITPCLYSSTRNAPGERWSKWNWSSKWSAGVWQAFPYNWPADLELHIQLPKSHLKEFEARIQHTEQSRGPHNESSGAPITMSSCSRIIESDKVTRFIIWPRILGSLLIVKITLDHSRGFSLNLWLVKTLS